MENASKALIIAGAILLSILLISLGIMVYNNAKGTISDANLDSEEAQAFNTKITQYCGTDKSGTTMNSLMDVIAGLNGAQNGKGILVVVKKGVSGVIPESKSTFRYGCLSNGVKDTSAKDGYPIFDTANRYTAECAYLNGYVFKVTIEQ